MIYSPSENSVIGKQEAKTSRRIPKVKWAIGLVWLFHISAIIGISLGFFDFFAPKTPLNLTLAASLLVWTSSRYSLQKAALVGLFFLVGMVVEFLGTNYGLFFGTYTYGENLGPKIGGVPWLIGINWAMLVLITGTIASQFPVHPVLRVIIGASLMILIDLPLEVVAPIFDFWEFAGGEAPLQNYVAWFVVAAMLHAFFQWGEIKENASFSLHLYGCQLLFFTYFADYYSL